MRTVWRAVIGLSLALAGSVCAAKPERVTAEGGCPSISHVPVVSVLRGTPAIITATVECQTGELGEVLLQIRLTDAGKPSPISMNGEGNGLYRATVPVSMVQGVTRFWYYVDVKGKNAAGDDTTAQTRWHPVNIIEHGETDNGGGGPGGRAGLYLLAGGAAAVGGALIIEHNNNDGSGNNKNGTGETPPPSTSSSDENKSSEESSDDDSPCKTTGAEQASIDNTSPCYESGDIRVFVCGNCPDADITAIASWGAARHASNVPKRNCALNNQPVLLLPKPDYFPEGPGSETISIFVNGDLIQQFSWPSTDDYYNCLD